VPLWKRHMICINLVWCGSICRINYSSHSSAIFAKARYHLMAARHSRLAHKFWFIEAGAAVYSTSRTAASASYCTVSRRLYSPAHYCRSSTNHYSVSDASACGSCRPIPNLCQSTGSGLSFCTALVVSVKANAIDAYAGQQTGSLTKVGASTANLIE
jgi:hypothetical protein